MSTRELLIKGGRVIDPSQGIDDIKDILISDGKIAACDRKITNRDAHRFDASNMIVMPGLIDMHTHLREPGNEEAETIMSGCDAAARGGFTAVCAMPNTNPATDDAGRVRFIIERAKGAKARVYPIGAITRARKGEELTEMAEMKSAGAVGFSDDGVSVANARVMFNALRYAQMVGCPLICHEEEPNLCNGGQMNEGALSVELGLRGMPRIGEEIILTRDIDIAEYTKTKFHATHLSTRRAVDIIRQAKSKGVKVTCDVTPHHLTLTEDLVATFDTRYKVNPPLRTQDDVQALQEGLRDGTIDAIATDHAPHYLEQKEVEFIYAAFGVTGLETALGIIHKTLIETGILTWGDVVRIMSCKPAEILSVAGGTLTVGSVADVTIYHPSAPWKVNPDDMKSKSRNTPFSGWELPGRAAATIVGGDLFSREL